MPNIVLVLDISQMYPLLKVVRSTTCEDFGFPKESGVKKRWCF